MKGQRRTGLWRVARTLAVAALLSLQPLMPAVEASHPAVPPADGFAPGLVLVKFKPLVPNFMADASLSVQGFRTLTTIYGSDVRKIAVAPGDEILSIAGLQSNPLVEYAEPDYTLEPLWIPNDTYYGPNQWNFRKIDLERAWDITRGSPTIRVAVVDTGLNMGNPDRPVNIASPWNECSGGPAIYDFNNHGTHVSGIIAANSNNGAGVAGVAPGISLMPITVECDGIIAVSSAAAAARYAADNGARVINVSLGTTQASQTWRDAIDYATGKGTLVVAAAGNGYQSGNQPVYPAAYPGVLAVGASTCEDERASYSQVQPYVAVVAPGGDASAFTDLDSSHWIMSTFGASYGSMAGTSQASPHVAGLAGLIWSVNPELTSAQVTGIITSTAVDLGPPGLDSQYGWGRIDAFAALVKAQTTAPLPSPTTTPTTVPPPTSTPTAVPVPSPTPLPTPTPIISNVPYRIHIPLLVKNGPGL